MTRLLVLQQKTTRKGCGGCLVLGTSSWFQSRCLTLSCWAGNNLFLANKVAGAERCFSRRGEASHTLLQRKPVAQLWCSPQPEGSPVPHVSAHPLWSCATVQRVMGGSWGQRWSFSQVWVQQRGCPNKQRLKHGSTQGWPPSNNW